MLQPGKACYCLAFTARQSCIWVFGVVFDTRCPPPRSREACRVMPGRTSCLQGYSSCCEAYSQLSKAGSAWEGVWGKGAPARRVHRWRSTCGTAAVRPWWQASQALHLVAWHAQRAPQHNHDEFVQGWLGRRPVAGSVLPCLARGGTNFAAPRRSRRRPALPTPTTSSPASPRGTTPRWGRGGCGSRGGRSSGWPSPGRLY